MPTIALHQKYRPKTLAELVGQPYVQTALTKAINRMQIALKQLQEVMHALKYYASMRLDTRL